MTHPARSNTCIGICSVEHNAGATTLSLATANYLHSKCRRKAAYIEVNGTNEISALADGRNGSFQYHGIRFFPNATFTALPGILTQSFQYYILDFGVLHPNNYREFVQCDLGFVVGSIAPWKCAAYRRFLHRYFPDSTEMSEHIRCLAALGIKEEVSAFARDCRIPIYAFPYLEQPFQLSSADWQFLQFLLRSIEL